MLFIKKRRKMKIAIVSFVTLVLTTFSSAQQVRDINIDFQQEKVELNTFFNYCVGAGRANEGLRADWQEQLRITQQECGFRSIRFHGIFHEDMGIYSETEEGTPIYNWQYVDKLYDFLLEIDIKPFVELSFMPKALASGDETVFWWKGNATPPKSYEKYYAFIQAFTQHLTDRYGEEEVNTWLFEVWNEPNHKSFFYGKKADYFKMYQTAQRAIKSVSPHYKVGGPASAGGGWVIDFVKFCKENNVSYDFVSTHAYGVSGFFDEFGKMKLKMNKNPNAVADQLKRDRKRIDTHGNKDAELHITEWSSSYSSHDPIHDTYMNASYVLNTLKQTEGITNSMSYWVFTDIFEEGGVKPTPFHGGFGLMNLQGIKKPTYYSYHYLNQLGNTELVNTDNASWICKEGDNVQCLIWDFTYLDQGKETNKVFFRKHHKSSEKSSVNLSVKNMKDGVYALEVYKTGYKHNDVFTSYFEMGLPSQLTRDQVAFLKCISNNQPIKKEIVKIENGQFENSIILNENDIALIKLNKL